MRLSPWDGTNFTEGNSERLREQAKETEVSVDGRPKPPFSVKERGSNGAFTLFAIFCLESFDEDSAIVGILFRVVS